MDHTNSGRPPVDLTTDADALLSAADKLRLAIRENPQAREAMRTVLGTLAQFLDSPDHTPGQMHTVVDNSPPDPLEVDTSSRNDLHRLIPDDCNNSVSRVVDVPLQLPLPGRIMLPPMVSPTSINTLKRSALVIEQDQSLSRMFAAYLKRAGYVVRTACKGEDALRLYLDYAPFDVVLVDYGMPRKNWNRYRGRHPQARPVATDDYHRPRV
jgi:hypothetical protein